MLEILQFIFSGFGTWLGTVILILVTGVAIGEIVSSFRPPAIKVVDVNEVEEFNRLVSDVAGQLKKLQEEQDNV
jgi:hypothetical protein